MFTSLVHKKIVDVAIVQYCNSAVVQKCNIAIVHINCATNASLTYSRYYTARAYSLHQSTVVLRIGIEISNGGLEQMARRSADSKCSY